MFEPCKISSISEHKYYIGYGIETNLLLCKQEEIKFSPEHGRKSLVFVLRRVKSGSFFVGERK